MLSIVFEKQMTGSVREAVAQTVAQRLPAEICRRLFFCPVAVDATVVMVAGAENEETLAHNVETVYKGAAKVVSAGMGCRCVAGVSRVFTSPEQIASAWHEASEALRSRGAASEEMRQDLTYYTTAEDNHTEHGYDTLLENEIIAAMTACNKRETERLIGVFLERLEEKGVRGYERMFYLQRLVSTLLMVAENAGLSVSKVLSNHSDNLFAEISRIYSNDKMRTFLVEEVAVPVMDLLGNFRRDNTSELVKNVIALIKQTNGDLTLNECAELFGQLYLESPQERAQHQLHRPRRFPETRDGQGTAAHHRYVGGPGGRHAALLQRAELHPVLQPRGRHDPRQVQKRIPDGQEKALTARTPDGCSAGGIFLPRNANTSCGKKVCRRGLTK